MQIRSLEGDDAINRALNCAMQSTLDCLVKEGLLKEEVKDKFLDEHVCLFLAQEGFKFWLKRFFKSDSDQEVITVGKIN